MRTAMCFLALGLACLSVHADEVKEWTFEGQTHAPTTEVRARVTGDLIRLAVREGDIVKKGDLLAEIDPRPYRLDLDSARARQKVAQAKLRQFQLKTANTKKLVEKNVVSRDELALFVADEAEAEATLMEAKVGVERAELTLSWTKVIAPFHGRVSRIRSTEGSVVTGNTTAILNVVAAESLYVVFNVPETILLQLRRDGRTEPGKLDVTVGFALDKDYPHTAKLDAIQPEVDSKTRTARFRATIPNPKGLLTSGLSARVRVSLAAK